MFRCLMVYLCVHSSHEMKAAEQQLRVSAVSINLQC